MGTTHQRALTTVSPPFTFVPPQHREREKSGLLLPAEDLPCSTEPLEEANKHIQPLPNSNDNYFLALSLAAITSIPTSSLAVGWLEATPRETISAMATK